MEKARDLAQRLVAAMVKEGGLGRIDHVHHKLHSGFGAVAGRLGREQVKQVDIVPPLAAGDEHGKQC